MIERLFFYGINMASNNIAIHEGVECPTDILAYAAETEFFVGNLAVVAAKEAMENVVFIFLIEKGSVFHHASPCIVSHSSLSVQSSVIPGHLFEDLDDFPVFHVGKLAIEGCYGKRKMLIKMKAEYIVNVLSDHMVRIMVRYGHGSYDQACLFFPGETNCRKHCVTGSEAVVDNNNMCIFQFRERPVSPV
jgi:hypothetical protein